MRILVIGGGSIGKRHIRNLHTLGYDDIYCLKRQRDAKFEQDLYVKTIDSYDEAKHIQAEAVFICTPTSLHNEGLAFAVENQTHIFMEKPLIHSWEGLQQAREILRNCQGRVFYTGFMLRQHEMIRRIKEALTAHDLGSIFSARFEFGSYMPNWHPEEDYRASYASRAELGGGVIFTISHEIDLMQYLLGLPEAVFCARNSKSRLDMDVEELAEAVFVYPDKIASLHLDYLQKDYERTLKILFDSGKLTWNWSENVIRLKKAGEEDKVFQPATTFDVNQLYINELKEFFSLIQNDQYEHELDQQHAIANMRLLLKMHDSIHKQKVEKL